MNRATLHRRRFLKLVGATALTAPFVRALPSYAGPTNTADPVYLVLLFTACGCVRYNWGAQGPTPAEPSTVVTPGPLMFRPTLAPLAATATPITPWVTVLDGLNNACAQGSHEAGMASLWTGLTSTGSQATGPSIDQVIAPLLGSQLNINRPYPTISLYAQSNQDYAQRQVDTRMLYDANGNFVDPMASPASALSTLFPSTTGSSMMKSTDNTAAIRAAVLSQVNADLTAMQGRLCNEDKQQLQSLQDLYNQANMQIQNAQMAAASCTAPTLGAAPGTGDPFTYNITAMSTILAMALACDLTRVASLQLSHALSPVTHTWLGSSQTQTHHIYSHNGPSSLWALSTCAGACAGAPNFYPTDASQIPQGYPQQLLDIEKFYATQVANFAYMLSQLTTSTGKNLLDQTVICWGSELDMGNAHNHDDTPFVLIGKGGGAVKANQLLTFPLNLGNNAGNNPPTNNRYHNDLLITLAQILGVELPGGTFGTTKYCSGPIMEALA